MQLASHREPSTASVAARLAILGLFAALAAGCSEAESPAAAQAPPADDAVPVSVVPVILRPSEQVLKFVGTLHGHEEVTVSSEVDGQIETMQADLGDAVERGQPLLQIDDDHLRARIREIEASLAKAKADERRGRELVEAKVVSPQEYESMETAVAMGEAQRETLDVVLRDTVVTSPISGYVALRRVSVGEYVRTGTPLFDLVADDPLKLRGDVPERFAADLAIGQPVAIRVDAYPETTFAGELTRISPTANQENRSISVEARVDNHERRLKPGFFANAGIVTRSNRAAMVVPDTAVIKYAGVTKVFIVRDGVAHERHVQTGARDEQGLIEIVEGVTEGEEVAVSGLAKLADGTRVAVTKPVS